MSREWPGYYPNVAAIGTEGVVVGWEEQIPGIDQKTVVIRCYDGREWGEPLEIYRDRRNGRYVSVAAHRDLIHALWFSSMSGSKEIYYARLRKR